MLEIFTLTSFLILCYIYIGYPLLLALLVKIIKPTQHTFDKDYLPSISMITACFNEEDVIREKINNCIAIDYPEDKLNFIFVSDGSEDNTDAIICEYEQQGIQFLRQEGRLGKTSALNLATKETDRDILVFSDANAMYTTEAIRKLARHFSNPKVGYVVGAALYKEQNEAASKSESNYWDYEIALKKMESDLSSVVGGDGAIYAARRELYHDLDKDDINDFVNPLQIVAQGFKGVFDAEAICYEEAAGSFDKEARRKQRIVNRSFNGLMKVKQVMNPFRTGLFSLQVISHKLLRWLAPLFIITFAVGSILLALLDNSAYKVISNLGIFFLWLAMLGHIYRNNSYLPKVLYIPYYFIMVNYYSLMGVLNALKGNIQITWSSPREKEQGNKEKKGGEKFIPIFFYVSTGILLYFINLQ